MLRALATPPRRLAPPCRKGQALNEVMFGGVSLGEGANSLDEMRNMREKGINIK